MKKQRDTRLALDKWGPARSLWQMALIAVLCLLAMPAALNGQTAHASTLLYSITDLGTLGGGTYSSATGINDAGQIVGYSSDASGYGHAVLWQNGTITDLGYLASTNYDTEAYAISSNGSYIAGYSSVDPTSNVPRHAFLWHNGSMSDLGTLPGGSSVTGYHETYGWGVNSSGVVVGDDTNNGAFIWQNGAMSALGYGVEHAYGINDSGQVVGYFYYPATMGPFGHAYAWQNGAITDLGTLGGDYSEARAINNSGAVVGAARTAAGEDHAFLWQNGTMTDLGTLANGSVAGEQSEGFAINNNSSPEVVGTSTASSGTSDPFVWQNGTMTDLANSLDTTSSGWILSSLSASGVNDQGQIVGTGDLAKGQQHAFLLTPTTAPVVYLHPSIVSFGGQNVGTTSSAADVVVFNNGNVPLSITSLTESGANQTDFPYTSTCGTTLAAGTSCVLLVSFAPTGTGTRSAVLTFVDNAADSPQTVSLTGTGTQPQVSLTPSSLAFGTRDVGSTSAAQAVTITNSGTGTLTFGSSPVTVTGANASDFSTSTTCGGTLTAGSSCTAAVTFTPSTGGTRNATLSVADNAPGNPQTVPLSGAGGVPAVSLSTSSVAFGNQTVGTTSQAQTVTITNSGTGTLTFGTPAVALAGANASDFALSSSCGSSLAVGATCSVTVSFSPSAPGSRTASVSLTDNAATSPQQIALSGTGITADVGITMSGASTVKSSGTESYSVTVKNLGPGNATGVSVVDPLPATLLYQSTTGPSCTTPTVGTSGTVLCSVGALGSGASVTFTLTATVNSGRNTTIANTAKVSSKTLDTNTANNSATVTTTVTNK